MACDYSGDHEKREWIIRRYMNEVLRVRSFDQNEVEDGLRSMRYRELARPLIIKDHKNGTHYGMLLIRFGLTRGQLSQFLKNYAK